MSDLKERQRALRLVEQLIEMCEGDDDLSGAARMLRDRLQLSMDEVLAKVPGPTSAVHRCKTIGISRQTYYNWLKGYVRPNVKQAKKLAELTGLSQDLIRGTWKRSVDDVQPVV